MERLRLDWEECWRTLLFTLIYERTSKNFVYIKNVAIFLFID